MEESSSWLNALTLSPSTISALRASAELKAQLKRVQVAGEAVLKGRKAWKKKLRAGLDPKIKAGAARVKELSKLRERAKKQAEIAKAPQGKEQKEDHDAGISRARRGIEAFEEAVADEAKATAAWQRDRLDAALPPFEDWAVRLIGDDGLAVRVMRTVYICLHV